MAAQDLRPIKPGSWQRRDVRQGYSPALNIQISSHRQRRPLPTTRVGAAERGCAVSTDARPSRDTLRRNHDTRRTTSLRDALTGILRTSCRYQRASACFRWSERCKSRHGAGTQMSRAPAVAGRWKVASIARNDSTAAQRIESVPMSCLNKIQ
jgi:hypothetical protein